ncbi:hypothetical protein QRO08_09905 [Paracidovorax citrulli]|uniref:Uncharacterized protein n=1 Tax=Paracidovorax citrulli TaxID=80869 RepID=A0ABY9AVL8_PARCI|nr:hypothetical protein [Paracidovorax citrulli]MVT29086.1 hypothetical protein [Paracidovorax citrulli]MVT36759.1 hypothetical protein [Paracidovorax citrulli]PVY67184.1 hypothetical protein C8E08_4619 [Paracidovorax citrulli]REG68653.1 hypothetical protein C8E07_1772 [Paracidovorax citrulli]RLJ93208.1 hypothetical protein C8E06_1772 [Paracidovorax citrulli]
MSTAPMAGSALIHMPKSYEIACPPGMLAHGHRIKRFTSLQAFEGYVAQLRKSGCTVRWDTPFTATVEATR